MIITIAEVKINPILHICHPLFAKHQAPASQRGSRREVTGSLGGTKGVWGVVSNNWFDCVFCFNLFTCSNPHVDRCSNPLPWDPLSSP